MWNNLRESWNSTKIVLRYFTQKQAKAYGLTGWVRNTPKEQVYKCSTPRETMGWQSHQVEGEAQGDNSAIENLIQDLNKGPSAARVSKLDHSDIDTIDGESKFEVRWRHGCYSEA